MLLRTQFYQLNRKSRSSHFVRFYLFSIRFFSATSSTVLRSCCTVNTYNLYYAASLRIRFVLPKERTQCVYLRRDSYEAQNVTNKEKKRFVRKDGYAQTAFAAIVHKDTSFSRLARTSAPRRSPFGRQREIQFPDSTTQRHVVPSLGQGCFSTWKTPPLSGCYSAQLCAFLPTFYHSRQVSRAKFVVTNRLHNGNQRFDRCLYGWSENESNVIYATTSNAKLGYNGVKAASIFHREREE